MKQFGQAGELMLNVLPVGFSSKDWIIGRLPYSCPEELDELQEKHWRTHAFYYDRRFNEVLNVPLLSGLGPLGELSAVDIAEYLLLASRSVQRSLLLWIAGKRPVIRGEKQLMFWGQADEALLLTRAVSDAGLQPVEGLEVPLRYQIECRMLHDCDDQPYLGLIVDVRTANVIDIPVAELIETGFDPTGRYVCRRGDVQSPYLHPTLRLIGRVERVRGAWLSLTDTDEPGEIEASDVLLEPRFENLDAVIRSCFGKDGPSVMANLRNHRRPVTTAMGKLELIRKTAKHIREHPFFVANDVRINFGDLVANKTPGVMKVIDTHRPTLLFGAQGRNADDIPDRGIRTSGPYMFTQHVRTEPLIAVVCEAQHRGTVEQFVDSLRSGFPDAYWQGELEANPFRGGLIGKFRLGGLKVEFEEAKGSSVEEYRAAGKKLLQRVARTPDLALIQIRSAFRSLPARLDPYIASKALFMTSGIPTQAIQIEKIAGFGNQLPYLLNNIALAMYAKLDGVPWVISTRGSMTHELVLGMGSAESPGGRLGDRERFVGITTVFQGDGRYLVWGATREVPFEQYSEALLDSLRGVVRFVKEENNWQPGDRIRLVGHVYKRLKDTEVSAIKELVRDLLTEQYKVEFAFLDVSSYHPYHIFEPGQPGRKWNGRIRGKGVPTRGICVQLGPRRALLQLTGPTEIKTDEQGLPAPIQIELHPESDLTDLSYLVRQLYHFTFASWQSFLPTTEPVTICYSRRIAELLAKLRFAEDWNASVISTGGLRDRSWFL